MKLLKKIYQAVAYTIRTHRAPKWVAEPVRMVAHRVMTITATVTTLLVIANQQAGNIPQPYRDRVSVVLGVIGVVVVFSTKVTAEVMRLKVFSPQTFQAGLTSTHNSAYLQGTSANSRKMSDGSALPGAPVSDG